MSDLETFSKDGKSYKMVPIYFKGEIIGMTATEVSAPVASPAESLFSSSNKFINDVRSNVEEQDEDDSGSQCGILSEAETDNEEESEDSTPVEQGLNMPPAVYQKTDEHSEPLGDDDSDTRSQSESSTGSSTLDNSVETEKDENTLTLTGQLNNYNFDKDLKVGNFSLIAVDGKYVSVKKDLAEFDVEKEYDLVFRQIVVDLEAEYFPELDVTEKVDAVESEKSDRLVCYKPTYKTLQKVQVRTGPGSKFEACGIIKQNEQVIVIQEGLLGCDLELVYEWMALHLPEHMVLEELVKERTIEKFPSFEDYVGDIDEFAAFKFEEEEQNIFLKALKAANRKVKVMWIENGIEKYGWISKKKNSKSSEGKKTKALITRVFGSAAPKVHIHGVSADIEDVNAVDRRKPFRELAEDDITFAKDALKYSKEHTKNTTIKDYWGEPKTVNRKCFPPMSFYKKLVKSEVCGIIGSKMSRFNIDWDGKFVSDRFCGLEKAKVVCNDGKTRYRTGYYTPDDCMTISFQRFSDAKKFLDSDLDETRFNGADVELDITYANEHPVDASMCPEFAQFKHQTKNKDNRNFLAHVASDLGIQRLIV